MGLRINQGGPPKNMFWRFAQALLTLKEGLINCQHYIWLSTNYVHAPCVSLFLLTRECVASGLGAGPRHQSAGPDHG